MDWYTDLAAIMPPPAETRAAAPQDWAAAEAALNTALPDDFKRYAETWGPAYVGGFLYTCAPAHQNSNVDLVENARYVSDALSTLKSHHPDRYSAAVFPEAGGFLANGRTDNGDFLGWMTRGSDPNAWPAAIWGDEDGAPQVFEGMGFGQMIHGIVAGTLRPEAFPDGLWKATPLDAAQLD
ncbi:hypothetical protein [Paracoccus contaminans]|uniref:Knr4/Smi1-like domain-containing protein n=1 Tax=Paracoccus contaminans TaxID=1945662 RepID=A0A1W6D1Q1_9RHOB|nr:hypothetical protein [Paracoccus contaminans]ARJ71025.1 hypothetical protein B0A89_14470 [Paracoccus contaminans]